MKRKALAGGVYVGADGKFYARPWIAGRRTWRKLKATKERLAIKEANGAPWKIDGAKLAAMAGLYLNADCPNRRLEPRPAGFVEDEKRRLKDILGYFGRTECNEVRLSLLPGYKAWRIKRCRRGTGERTVDQDLVTLSNVLNYGVAVGKLDVNYIRNGRPRFRKTTDVRHSREVAPTNADTIHQIAAELFKSARSETLGWLLLFSEFTGCRTGELLKLRLDAKTEQDPGFVSGQYLFLRRSKGGVNPWAIIGPEFAEMFKAFVAWHAERYPKSKWFFPSIRYCGNRHVDPGALGHALARVCRDLKLKHITPHGLRSFYVTKRRSDGVTDTIIAGEIGDKTVNLMQTTYGNRPPNWTTGGKALSWVPADGKSPAWLNWRTNRPVLTIPVSGGLNGDYEPESAKRKIGGSH